jgi:anaerobic magnesium-protoporphyrin IX monomethyl ester cyclase
MVSLTRNTFQIAEMLRASLPDSLIVAGGPLPTLYPKRYARQFDAVFRGESDLSFPRFCRDFFEQRISRERLGELPLDTYEGLFIQDHELGIDNPTVHYTERNIQSFPLPDRSDFDHAAYQKVWFQKDGSKTTSIITTLGCPFSCDFCSRPVFGSVLRRRNLDAVFEEIEQIRLLGYDNLWIADDNFTLNLPYLEEFCRHMAARKINWSCLSRVTGIDAETARLMKEAGCQRVYLGLETGSQATLELMNKKATLEEGINAVHQFRTAGIEVAAFFIVGYPGETVSSIEETFRLALTLPLDYISFNVPFPLPGSKLFDRVSGVDEAKDWSKENEVTFVYRSEFDARWLRRRIGQTMRAFAEKKK